jgi:hypothetical protein
LLDISAGAFFRLASQFCLHPCQLRLLPRHLLRHDGAFRFDPGESQSKKGHPQPAKHQHDEHYQNPNQQAVTATLSIVAHGCFS